MLSTHRRTQNKWDDVKDYWDARTANGTSDFYKNGWHLTIISLTQKKMNIQNKK